jgi:hypothetical protein
MLRWGLPEMMVVAEGAGGKIEWANGIGSWRFCGNRKAVDWGIGRRVAGLRRIVAGYKRRRPEGGGEAWRRKEVAALRRIGALRLERVLWRTGGLSIEQEPGIGGYHQVDRTTESQGHRNRRGIGIAGIRLGKGGG